MEYTDAEDDEPEETEEFPNIYRGPSESIWRQRNADAFDTVKSLDGIRSQDLSIHIYNSTILTQQGLTTSNGQLANGAPTSKDVWRPPKAWTAWPLPPSRVPYENEYEPGATMLNLPSPYINRPVKPSLLLEENLQARLLKQANASLKRARANQESLQDTSNGKAAEKRGSGSVSDSDDDSKSPSPTLSNAAFLTDDDQAREILNPSIRHILSQLNNTLTALHTSFQSYGPPPEGRSHSRSSRRRSGTPAPQRGRRPSSASSPDPDAERGRASNRSRSSFRERSRRRRQRLGLRDWNDVLGCASAAGWDVDVVERAGRRCEEMFGGRGEKSGWRMMMPPVEMPEIGKGYLQPVRKGKRVRDDGESMGEE